MRYCLLKLRHKTGNVRVRHQQRQDQVCTHLNEDRVTAQSVSGSSLERHRFDPGPIYLRFMVDKMALG